MCALVVKNTLTTKTKCATLKARCAWFKSSPFDQTNSDKLEQSREQQNDASVGHM